MNLSVGRKREKGENVCRLFMDLKVLLDVYAFTNSKWLDALLLLELLYIFSESRFVSINRWSYSKSRLYSNVMNSIVLIFTMIFAEWLMRSKHWKQFFWITSSTLRKMMGIHIFIKYFRIHIHGMHNVILYIKRNKKILFNCNSA